jgi:proline dehydrogenase
MVKKAGCKMPADDLVTSMMRKYNKETYCFNTQMYRWDRLNYLKSYNQIAKEEGFHIGMKLVRGAYMEKENNEMEEKVILHQYAPKN